jgi:hypothetical protein
MHKVMVVYFTNIQQHETNALLQIHALSGPNEKHVSYFNMKFYTSVK